MCGIAGMIMAPGAGLPDTRILKDMQASLHRRGPDGEGIFTADTIALMHTRLSIIDVAASDQPMTDQYGRTLCFNGEIYNYREIRDAMGTVYPFQTEGDSETILALYHYHGLEFIHHLRGMYAFALYDPDRSRVVLARDPFGIKPLYLHQGRYGVCFASEMKGLEAYDKHDPSIDPQSLRQLLKQNYMAGSETPCPSYRRLQPGEMRVYEGGRLASVSHRKVLPEKRASKDGKTALQELDRVLMDSVDVHCRSDVGYGIFLSGGVDSTSIAACLHRQEVKDIQAYTCAFEAPGSADERDVARRTARDFGLRHNEILLGEADFWDLLPRIAAYMDDPVTDYAILPTWKLAETAARDQKVILCGEGGDELFAGYGRYKPRWWKDWRKWGDPQYRQIRRTHPHWSALQLKQARDIYHWLPNDLLIKLDTCLMAHGLEGRTPFLDPVVADMAFALPDKLKQRDGHGKYILKQWLQAHYPDCKPFRKKQGFTVPVGTWIDNRKSKAVGIIQDSTLIREVLTKREFASLPDMPGQKLWPLLYCAYWGQTRF